MNLLVRENISSDDELGFRSRTCRSLDNKVDLKVYFVTLCSCSFPADFVVGTAVLLAHGLK